MGVSRLINRNITAAAGRTSMRLEPEIWEALREICHRENKDLRELIRAVEEETSPGGRTSAVRVHVVQYFRAAATRDGHLQAGHGLSGAGLAGAELAGAGLVAPGEMDDDLSDEAASPGSCEPGAPLNQLPPPMPVEDVRAALDA